MVDSREECSSRRKEALIPSLFSGADIRASSRRLLHLLVHGPKNQARLKLLMMALLCGLTLATFWPITHHPFVNYDDNFYVTDNSHVRGGLTLGNVIWAFRSSEIGNWHP